MLVVRLPPSYQPERLYICRLLLGEFLGLPYRVEWEPGETVRVSLEGDETSSLQLLDLLFQTSTESWLTPASLPVQPLAIWDLRQSPVRATVVNHSLPVLYGRPLEGDQYWREDEHGATLGLDIFGSAFFCLTRYEEVARPVLDERERFPASASLAQQEGFLDRPVVNEYLELFWWSLQRLWPGLQRRQRTGLTRLSHDVDSPLCTALATTGSVLKSATGDLFKRRDLSLAAARLHSCLKTRSGNQNADLCNTFDWIMDQSEAKGLKSAFYFIADHTAGRLDGRYEIDSPWIGRLMRRIHDRGHEIGLHPSYNSYRSPQQIGREFTRLKEAAMAHGVDQVEWGGRQHYLRWEAPTTWEAWETAGLDYDSTLSFAEAAGFRCGTCYEYPVFNLRSRRPLRLRERPLIVMEVSLLEYMGLSITETAAAIERLRQRCQLFAGEFTLLWHNCRLIRRSEAQLYQCVLANV